MKGITKDIDIKAKVVSLLWSSLVLIIGDNEMVVIIKIMLIIISIGNAENISFLLLLLSSEINLDKAIGKPNCDRFINKEKVGITNIYIPNVSGFSILAVVIFISILNSLVMKPPIIKIIVDLKKLFFIINSMKNIKKYIIMLKYMILFFC